MTDEEENARSKERVRLASFALACLSSDDRERIEDLSLDLSVTLRVEMAESLALIHSIARHMQPKKKAANVTEQYRGRLA